MNFAPWATLAAAALGLSAFAGDSRAEPVNLARMTLGYSYYNRPGADLATHNNELADCLAEATKVRSLDEQLHNGQGMGLVGALVGDALSSAAHRGVVAASLENCMVVHGWRVVRLSDSEGAALAAVSAAELTTRLTPWIGAQTPHGEIVRAWGNDAAKASTTRFAIRPDHTNDGQLSLKLVTEATLKQFIVSEPPRAKAPTLDPKWPRKSLKPEQVAGAPPETGVIVFHLVGMSMHNGVALAFNREGPQKDLAPAIVDHAPDSVLVAVGLLFAKKEGNFVAYALPPGRWRLLGMGLIPMINFCLGSPSFEVKAGEVVYAGSFDLGAEDLGPDLSLGRARAWLAGQPAAATIRPAVYTNGSLGQCGPNSLYALEIKGAPFEPGYSWGGAATNGTIASPAPTAPSPQNTPPANP